MQCKCTVVVRIGYYTQSECTLLGITQVIVNGLRAEKNIREIGVCVVRVYTSTFFDFVYMA